MACRRLASIEKGTVVVKLCQHCDVEFDSKTTARRIFCSYRCFINSGGAQRAGKGRAISMKKYGAKKDANHKELVGYLVDMKVGVFDASGIGGGFPDLICNVRRQTVLVEIKNLNTSYGRKGLNNLQKKWAESWSGGPVYIISDRDECVLLANGKFEDLLSYGGYDMENVKLTGQ